MTSRITKVALAVAVVFLMTSASFAQAPWWQGNGNNRWGNWGYQNGQDNAYDRGVRDGRDDRAHNRSWHPRNQGQAYLNGYRAGYGQNGGGWQGRNNGNYGNNGPYRNPNGTYGGNNPYGGYGGYGGNNAQNVAYNNGYQEGLSYGQSDRSRGKSYEPTGGGHYQSGTDGYNSSYGDKSAYKNAYRQGYLAGYQRGYNGGGGRRY